MGYHIISYTSESIEPAAKSKSNEPQSGAMRFLHAIFQELQFIFFR